VIHSGCADAAAAYEQMRHHVFQGSAYGSHSGLILVIREGVAAWIDRGATGFTPAAASTNVDRVVALPALSPQLHAGIVDVLVNIALTTREEMNT
jgi:hypothetical protein